MLVGQRDLNVTDVGAYTVSTTDAAPINTPTLPVPSPQFVTPSKNILILEARVTSFAAAIVTGELAPDITYFSIWSFAQANSPGIPVPSQNNRLYIAAITGHIETFLVMRRVAAGENWAIVPLSASWSCGLTPPVAWYAIANITIFYILTN